MVILQYSQNDRCCALVKLRRNGANRLIASSSLESWDYVMARALLRAINGSTTPGS